MPRKLERKQHLLLDCVPRGPEEHRRASLLPGVHLRRRWSAGVGRGSRSTRHSCIAATKLDVQIRRRRHHLRYQHGRVCGHGGRRRRGPWSGGAAPHELHPSGGDSYAAVRPLGQLPQAYYTRKQWFMGV